jgi:tetratricopeptide (TPR) repeat protein
LNDEPVLACPPSKLYRLGKFVRRHKVGLGVTAVLLLAMLLGASSGLWWLQKRAGAEGAARTAIREANEHLEAERWSEALSAAQRAEGILAGVGGDADLGQQTKILIEDLEMARKLQEARLRITAVKDGHFDIEAGAMAYADAFREYGLDVVALDPHMVAEQIRARPIQLQLVAALNDWTLILKTLKAEGWRQRLAVARAADEDPWRNRLRDWLEGKDPQAVEELAAADVEEEWPAQTLELLGKFAFGTASAERVVALLERAQQRHPDDFWINQSLVVLLNRSRPRRLEKEIRFASVAVALRPQSPGAHYNLGLALHHNGQQDEAIPEYREAIRLKEDYAEAHVQLGDALADKGRLDEAITKYREAIRIKKNFPEAHDNLGRALLDKGQVDAAIPELREALKSDFPAAYKAHNGLGTALGFKGQLNEAIDEFRAAIRLNKDCVEAHFNLGIALGMKDRLDESIDAYRAAIRIKKDYANAHLNLGNALKAKGLLDEAITEYRGALNNDFPGAYMAHGNLGDAFQEKGQLDKALAEYREGIRLKRDDAQLYNHLARLLATCPDLKLRDAGQAVANAKKAVDLAPGNGECWNTRGIAQYRNGDWKAAIAALNKSVQLRKGGDSSDFFFLAMTHWQLNDKDKARVWYDQAVAWMNKHNPQNKELKRFREEATALLGLAKAVDAQNKNK